MAAANTETVDRADHRLHDLVLIGRPEDGFGQWPIREHVLRLFGFGLRDVEARTKVPVAFGADHRDANFQVVPHLGPNAAKHGLHAGGERVAPVGARDGDERDLVAHFEAHALEIGVEIDGLIVGNQGHWPASPAVVLLWIPA